MSGRYDTLQSALLSRYPSPSWALFFEVHDKTGSHSRSADAIAMGLWKSRGLDLHGFEFKSDRGDWLRELKDPEKAERISTYCDYWWLVAGSDTVARLEEIPKNWGFLVKKGKHLQMLKGAPQLEATPITRDFLAALLRRAHESVMCDPKVTSAIEKAREEAKSRAEDNLKHDVVCAQRERDHQKAAIEEFEKASGIRIKEWEAGKLGEAVHLILRMKVGPERDGLLERVRSVRELLKTNLDDVEDGLTRLEQAFKASEPPGDKEKTRVVSGY